MLQLPLSLLKASFLRQGQRKSAVLAHPTSSPQHCACWSKAEKLDCLTLLLALSSHHWVQEDTADCSSSWHFVAQGSVCRHEASLLERPLQDVTPRNTGMLCKYLFEDCDFISIICLHQILSFGIVPCLCFTSGTGACLLHPWILLNIFRKWASQFLTE